MRLFWDQQLLVSLAWRCRTIFFKWFCSVYCIKIMIESNFFNCQVSRFIFPHTTRMICVDDECKIWRLWLTANAPDWDTDLEAFLLLYQVGSAKILWKDCLCISDLCYVNPSNLKRNKWLIAMIDTAECIRLSNCIGVFLF